MEDGGGLGDYFVDSFISTQHENDEKKPAARVVRKRKTNLGKSRKRHEKTQEISVTSTCATDGAEVDDSSDFPALLSSTSTTEGISKIKVKELKITNMNGKSRMNFAKIVKSLSPDPFTFQKRLSRLDWRKLNAIDVDKVIREVDLDALESVLDTITFADMQGEDSRNFSDTNFIKVFRLAQLMVEYLLHVQQLLAKHKEKLLESGQSLQVQVEKNHQKQIKLLKDLSILRHEYKQAKKTIRTYEVMLRVQNKCQHRQQKLHESQREQQLQIQQQQSSAQAQTVRCCPLCDKMFESAHYLDLHVARRHPKSNEIPEETIMAAVAKAEELTMARVRAETTAALQDEIKRVQAISQAELQRSQAVGQLQISALEASLRESNAKLQEVQNQLHSQTVTKDMTSQESKMRDLETQQSIREMESEMRRLRDEIKHAHQQNLRLEKELEFAHSEVAPMQTEERQGLSPRKGYGERQDKSGNWKRQTHQPASSEKTRTKERRKWKDDPSCSSERSEVDDESDAMIGNQSSSPERKRKQRWGPDLQMISRSTETIKRPYSATEGKGSSSSGKHRKYKSQEDLSPGKATPSLPSGNKTPKSASPSPRSPSERQTPHPKVLDNVESGIGTPPSGAQLTIVGEKAFAEAKAEIEKDLVRAGGSRLFKDDDGKVASKIATFETKFKSQKVKCEAPQGSQKPQEEVARYRRKKEMPETNETTSADEEMDQEENIAKRKAEIVDAASMDVGEDRPSIPQSEKEKWLEEHPYKPVPQRPHVLSKFPHPPNVFLATRDELVQHLDEQVGGELKKFGFEKDTGGISDSVYDAAKASLEKQQKARVSSLHSNQKKTLEYERGAVLWQTQRAVRERDIQIIESQFDMESDPSSQRSPSAETRSPSGGDSEDNSTVCTSNSELVSSTKQQKKSGRNDRRTPSIRSPLSSMSPALRSPTSPLSPHLKVHERVKRETGHIADTLETLENVGGSHKQTWRRERKHVTYGATNLHSSSPNRLKPLKYIPPRDSYDDHQRGKDQDTPHNAPTYLFPTLAKFKRAEEDRSKIKEEDENQGEAYGLGQWDSDEEIPPATTISTLRGEGKLGTHDSEKAKARHNSGFYSDNESEESKIFQQLDADIDEIIRL